MTASSRRRLHDVIKKRFQYRVFHSRRRGRIIRDLLVLSCLFIFIWLFLIFIFLSLCCHLISLHAFAFCASISNYIDVLSVFVKYFRDIFFFSFSFPSFIPFSPSFIPFFLLLFYLFIHLLTFLPALPPLSLLRSSLLPLPLNPPTLLLRLILSSSSSTFTSSSSSFSSSLSSSV